MDIFTLVGKMTIDGLDKTGDQLKSLESKTQQVQKSMKIMGAAFTAVGAAGLAMVAETKKINALLSVTAVSLGVTTKEMRDLTLATTDVTFPIDEVVASFDLLARAGIKDMEVLKATAKAFDALADATGSSASQVTEVMIPAMKTFRLSAEEIASKTDMMTYMVRNSTTSLEDFNTMVGYTSQDMVDAGLTIDDMAAAMMYMSDQGVEPGKVMLREWNKAVTQSKEENISMTEALGMTNDELEIYRGNLEGATGLTQELADLQNEQFTIIQKLKQEFKELTLRMSGTLEPLEPLLAGMTALGPAMIFVSSQIGIQTIKWVAHTIKVWASVAAHAALNATIWGPLGILLGLVAIGIALNVASDKWVTYSDNVSDATTTHKDFAHSAEDLAKGQLALNEMLGKTDKELDATEASLLANAAALKATKDATGEYNTELLEEKENLMATHEWLGIKKGALEDLQKQYDSNEGTVKRAIRQMEYEESAAGKLGISVDDVIVALTKMGWESKDITRVLYALGEEGNNVNAILEATGLTALEVADKLGIQIEALGKLKESYDKAGEAADTYKAKVTAADVKGATGAARDRLMEEYWSDIGDRANEIRAENPGMSGGEALSEAQKEAGGIGQLPSYAGGGIAMGETIARIGENAPRVPEAVIPLDSATLAKYGIDGFKTANIYLQVDGRTFASVIGQPLVEEIILKTGFRR